MIKENWWFCPKCEHFFPDGEVNPESCPDCLYPYQLIPFGFNGKQIIANRKFSKRITELWKERNGSI